MFAGTPKPARSLGVGGSGVGSVRQAYWSLRDEVVVHEQVGHQVGMQESSSPDFLVFGTCFNRLARGRRETGCLRRRSRSYFAAWDSMWS